jgi:hypothetical protein
MIREQQPAISLFSIGMISLGTLSAFYRDFAYDWQSVPAFHPGRDVLAVACGLFMIAASVGLLFRATAAIAARAIFPFLLAWLCLKIPALIVAPRIEGVWIGFGEIGMLLAGGWVLFARLSGLKESAFFRHITGTKGIRIAQIIFGRRSSRRTRAYLLCRDHGQSRSIVDAFPNWPCLPDWCWTDCLRPGSPVFYLAPSGSPHRNGDAGSVCLPGLGTRYLDSCNAEAGWNATRRAVSPDRILYHVVIGASALLIANNLPSNTVELIKFGRGRGRQADPAGSLKGASR